MCTMRLTDVRDESQRSTMRALNVYDRESAAVYGSVRSV